MRVLVITSSPPASVLGTLPGDLEYEAVAPGEEPSEGEEPFDLCVLLADGAEDIDGVHARWPDTPLVLLVPQLDMGVARAALRAGALELLRWPDEAEQLLQVVARETSRRRPLRDARSSAPGLEGLVGTSTPMRRMYRLVERIAPSDASVVIAGETGTGKELVARSIHALSPRSQRPFVAINCTALPEALLESELFGHTRGAFTDAHRARAGLFIRAQGGTLFLDEIAEMPAGLQPKLLRALQERTLRPVGSDDELPFDVRVVAATNLNLEAAVGEGRFRQDLYYRLAVIQLDLPPLRERGSDVLLLADAFLRRAVQRTGRELTGFTRGAAKRLMDYSWPGNVRELQNCVERAVALAEHSEITIEDLPERVRNHKPSHVLVTAARPSDLVSMDEVERRYIRRVLAAVDGNRQHAASILGMDRKTLYRKLKRYDLDEPT